MKRNELIQIQHDFISTFQTLTREEKLQFLNFNRYHHKRPIQDILSIFIQYPDARYLGTFEFWKHYSSESSVQFGQKVAVKLYDKQGRLSEQLFDIAQTTLHTVPEIHDTVLSDRLLTNSLAELTDNDYFIGEEHYGQYFESISDYIEQYIKEHVPAASLEKYSPKQQKLALALAKYNICEEFGAFLEDSERYEAFLDNIATSIDEMGPEDNLLRTFALGNNYSKELSTQVYNLYEEVENRTENLVQEQASLNNKIASLDSDLSFGKPDIFDVQNEGSDANVEENLTEETEILPSEEKPVSDTLYNTTVPTLNFKINDSLGALFIQLYSSDQEQRGAAQISPALLTSHNIGSISDEEKIQNTQRREDIISAVQKSPNLALDFIKEVKGRISWKKDGENIYDILPSIDYTNLSWESISKGLEEVSPQYHNLVHEPNHTQENQQQTTEGIDDPLASDKAFLEAVIEHFELPDNFIITQDEYSTDLVKGNFWGTEKVLSMDGELEIYGAASALTEIKDFNEKVSQYYFDYTNQEFQYKVGDILFLEGQYMASGYDEELIKISSLPEDSSQPMSTEKVVRRIVDNRQPTDYNYHPQLEFYRYQTVKARLASDEEIEIFNTTKDKATTKEVNLFEAEEDISEPSFETINFQTENSDTKAEETEVLPAEENTFPDSTIENKSLENIRNERFREKFPTTHESWLQYSEEELIKDFLEGDSGVELSEEAARFNTALFQRFYDTEFTEHQKEKIVHLIDRWDKMDYGYSGGVKNKDINEAIEELHQIIQDPSLEAESKNEDNNASDKALLEAVIQHFELSDKFIITQDETSTDLVKENPWGTEVLLSLDGELEVSGAAWGLTDDKDFDKHVKQFYFDYTNQEFQYKVGDFFFLERQYMASGYDEELIKISSVPEDSSQPMLTERVARRIVDGHEPTDYSYYPQLKLYRYETVKARLASDEEIEIFNATKDKATTKEVNLFDTEEEISEPSTETIDLDFLSPEEIEQQREREIKEDLLRGSGIQEGKFRIYYFFKNNGSSKDRISFLKDEYGVGGHSAFGENKYTQMHDAKGLRFYSSNDEVLLPWKNVAERLDFIIASNDYLSTEEQEKYKTWKSDKEKSNQDYTNENDSKSEDEDLTLLSDDELLDGLRESYNTMIGKNGNVYRKGAFTRWAELRSEESRRRTESEKNNIEISLFDVLEDTPSNTESKDDSPTITEEKIAEVVPQNNQDKVNFVFPEEDIYPKTPREKVDANIEAIQLVKRLDEEKRLATPFEQQVLARYVGWGGIANKFFDESNPIFEEQRNTLKKLVSLAEYSAMRESSLTAYYTDPQLIQKMYASLENLGFTGGKILDPSMGTGNFYSALPEALQDNSELYGVELDKITGQIAKQLHQATNIQVTGFEQTKFVDNALDLVITNVPFGQIPIVDKRYEKNHVIHDYFIKRSLDLVHEGGFVAVIASTATMDKRDDRVRSELARQANLVTAARLPKNVFTAIAGTDVSSDILIFQKTSTPNPSPEWLETTSLSDDRGNTVHYNKYFENHPDHILGHIKIETFNGGTLSITPEFSLDDLPMELGNVLSDTQIEIQPFEKNVETLQVLEKNKLSDQTEDFNIEPYTIEVNEGVPYYHNGEEVIRHQKTSSITLNANETRPNQLNRFEKVKDRIFDKKISYKNIFSGAGYFDSWSNFIFTPAKANTPSIPHEVLEMLNDGYDQTIHEDHRYTVSKGKDNLLTLTVEEAVSTKYIYTQDYNSRDVKAMQGMIDLRHSLQDVLNIQRIHDISEPEYKADYETLLRRLNDKYDTFVEKYGAVSRPENATLLRRDDYYPFLTSIEQEKENSLTHEKEYSKAPVFFGPTIQPLPQSVVVSSAGDALLASLNHKGKLDFEYMTDVYEGHTREDIIQELGNQIFYEGNGQYATREEYLSGDVKTKLSLAKTNHDFEVEGYDWSVNIQALEEVIPLDLPLSDINYRLGARFIPISVYQRFLAEQFEQKGYYDGDYNAEWITIEYDDRGDSYKVSARMEGTYGLRDKFGLASKNYPGDKLATELLNLRDPKIYKPDPNDPTGKKRVLDEVATEAIQDKGKMLTSAFKDWVLKTPDVQMQIVQIYNEKFNRYVGRTYDGSQLIVNGLAKQFKLRPHQANAVMRAVIEGRAGLAHEVGAGKTLTLLASARKMKELDIAQKPLFVIPKPLVEQFGREVYQYFPESHVLIAQSEDFQKENRKRFVSRILTGKYDFIVIADSQFGKIAMSKEYQEHYILTQLEAERSAMANMDEKSFTVKKIEQRVKRMEKTLEDLQKKDTDSFINFEELGIDLLVVDEAHNFKNLAPMTQLENVKGISDTRSQKAMDLQQKIEFLQNQYNYRRVIFSTGTPLSNSVVEMYTMMRYTEPDVLARYDVLNFDTWVSTFGMIENNFELTAAGTFKINRRFVKFGNMQELMNMFKETWDIQTSNMLDLPVPEAEIITHKSPITEAQKLYTNDLIQRATNIERGAVKPWEDNMLRIVGENKKLSLDMRTLDDKYYTAEDSNKLSQVINTVFDIYKKYDEQKGTQIIFSDMSVPLKYRNSQARNTDETINSFSAYDEIKAELVKKGIPEQEVRFIHEATDKTKAVMMQEMREGKIRILLGSTGKAGTGLNVQDKLIAVHHLDVPWRPSDVIQRNGRIIRQGNENKKVQIHYYITPGTMDSFLWQTQENKIKFTEQVMEGTSTSREMEEMETAIPTASQLKAAANGNPLQAEFMQIEMELQGLERSRNRFYEEQARSQERVLKDQEKLPQVEKLYEKQQLDVQNARDTQDKPFELTLHFNDQSRVFTEEDKKSDVGLALVGRINTSLAENNLQANKIMQHIATYRGFEIYHNPSAAVTGQTTIEEHLFMKGHAQYSCMVSLESPTGILTRLNNKIDEGIERSAEATLKDISRLQSAIAQTKEDKAKLFPDEDVYHTKKARHTELKDLLRQQKSDDVTAIRDVTDDFDMEM